MIKVPARNKFTRKTSHLFKPEQNSIVQRKDNRNRQSILMNGPDFQQYLSLQNCQKSKQDATKSDFYKQKHTLVSPFALKGSLKRKNSRNKSELQNEPGQRQHNQNFNKVRSSNFNKISFQQKQENKSDKSNFKSKQNTQNTHIQKSLKESYVKNSSNTFKKKDETTNKGASHAKKPRILNNLQVIANQSYHLQQIIRDSTLYQKIKQKKQSREIQKIEQKKSHHILKSSLKNSRKISNNQLKTRKDSQKGYRDMFKNLTQNNIIIDIEGQSQKKIICCQTLQIFQNQQLDDDRKEEQLLKKQQKRIQQELIYEEQTQQLFRKLERQIASKQELKYADRKSKNFYEELRIKLTKKYSEISRSYKLQESDKYKISILIQGCNLEKHRRVNNFYFEKKEFSHRPETAGALDQASKDINNLNFVTKQRNKTIMRPRTSRPKSIQIQKSRIANQKSQNMISDYITIGAKTQRQFMSPASKRSFRRLSGLECESIFCLTNTELMKPAETGAIKNYVLNSPKMTEKQRKKALKRQNQQLMHKFDNFLNGCDQENQQYHQTKNKMKVFQYYCQKMDNGFQKLGDRIKDYLSKL